MTTLVATLVLTPERTDEVLARWRGEVAPWLRRLPGFVASRWLLTEARDRCVLVIDVGDDEHGSAVAAALVDALQPGVHDTARSWWCERLDLVGDLGLAARPAIAL